MPMDTKDKIISKFIAYDPMLKPLSRNTGGGFRFSVEVTEDQYEQIKDLNDPLLKNSTLLIEIKKQN